MQSSRVVAFLILFLGFQCIQASGQRVVATWTDASGDWSNPANWSTLTVPNNGGAPLTRIAKSLARREASEAAEEIAWKHRTLQFASWQEYIFPVPASKKPDDRQCKLGDRVVKTDP